MCSAAARFNTLFSMLGMMSGHSGLALCSPKLHLRILSSVQDELRARSHSQPLPGVREKRAYLHINEEGKYPQLIPRCKVLLAISFPILQRPR